MANWYDNFLSTGKDVLLGYFDSQTAKSQADTASSLQTVSDNNWKDTAVKVAIIGGGLLGVLVVLKILKVL